MRRLTPYLALSLVLHFWALLSLLDGVQAPGPVRLWSAEILLSAPIAPPQPQVPALKEEAPPSPQPRMKPRPEPRKAAEVPAVPEPAAPAPEPAGHREESPASAAVAFLPTRAETESSDAAGAAFPGPERAIRPLRPDPDELARFWAAVRNRIEQNQQYPLWAHRNNLEGVVVVRFTLTREGLIHEIELDRSSGHRILDEAALQAVQRGVPYPPVPEGVPEQQCEARIPIRFSIQERP